MRRSILLTALLALLLTATAGAQTFRPRIVGGTTAAAGTYPWQVAMLTTGGSQYCGGTLIGTRLVLTADHCEPLPGEFVRVNSVDRASGGQVIAIAEVLRHPSAFPGGYDTDGAYLAPRFDANIVVLAQDVADPRPLAVATAAERSLWADGTLLTITGWGTLSSGGASSRDLQEAQVPAVADATCASAYWEFDAQDMVCAGFPAGGVDTCQGDSGGPLAAPAVASPSKTDPADWRLVGVTSWGAGCADPGYPGVYARMGDPALGDWVRSTLSARAITPPPAEPEEGTPVEEEPAPADDFPPPDVVDEPAPAVVPPPVVAPEPAPARPITAPVTATAAPDFVVSRRCTQARRCSFTIRPTAAVAAVRASVRGTIRRRCTRREMRRTGRTTCRKTVSQRLRARRAAAATYTAGTSRLRRGRYTLVLTALDGAGHAAASRRLSFTVR